MLITPHMELVACLVVALVLAMYAVRRLAKIEESMREQKEQMTRQNRRFDQVRQESQEATETIVGEWKANAERVYARLSAIEHRLSAKPQEVGHEAIEPDAASVGLWANYQGDAGFVQRYTNAMSRARRLFEETLRNLPDLVEASDDSGPWKPGVVVRWLAEAERPFLNEASAWFHRLSADEKAQWRYRYLSAADQSYEDHWQRARIQFEDELSKEVVRLATSAYCPLGVSAAQIMTFVRRAEASALAIQHSGYPNERVPGVIVLEALRQPIGQFPLEGSGETKAANDRAVLRAHGNEYGLQLLHHQESTDALLRACAQLFGDLGVLNPDAKAAVFQKPREVRMGRRFVLSLDRFHGAAPSPGIGKTEDFDIVETIATWHFFGGASSGGYEKYQNWKSSRL